MGTGFAASASTGPVDPCLPDALAGPAGHKRRLPGWDRGAERSKADIVVHLAAQPEAHNSSFTRNALWRML